MLECLISKATIVNLVFNQCCNSRDWIISWNKLLKINVSSFGLSSFIWTNDYRCNLWNGFTYTGNFLRSPPWLDYLLRNVCVTNDHGPVLFLIQDLSPSFFYRNNTTNATSVAYTHCPTGAPEFIPYFSEARVAYSVDFCVVYL